MIRHPLPLLAVVLFFLGSATAIAQTYTAKSILFKGATGYTDADLMAATGLKTDVPMTSAAMDDAVKILVDTGLFEDVSFQFKDGELVFTITPSTLLKEVVLDNLPLKPGAGLDAKIRARVPLYRGKVPTDGMLLEAVRQVLEEEVDAEGINSTIIVRKTLTDDTTIHFQQSMPSLRVGTITLSGASKELVSEARQALAQEESTEFSTLGSPKKLESALTAYYNQRGYLKATVNANLQFPPIVNTDGVDLPMLVTVKEGPQYHLGTVQLSPELGIDKQDFERRTGMYPGTLAQAALIQAAWQELAGDFLTRGYMRARVIPKAAWDYDKALVSFSVTAEPGPLYTMGKLIIDNANDELRAAITGEWAMPSGAVFSPEKMLGRSGTKPKDPDLLRYLASEELKYTIHLNDDAHTVDVTLHLEKKSP